MLLTNCGAGAAEAGAGSWLGGGKLLTDSRFFFSVFFCWLFGFG